jgi:hypothetical protein
LGHHYRAPSVPKRHSQTGLDTKGVATTTKTAILLFQN